MKTIIYSILILLLPYFLKAQTTTVTAVNFNLNAWEGSNIYKARDYIKLSNGFKTWGNLKAQIDEDLRFDHNTPQEDYIDPTGNGVMPTLPFVIDKNKTVGTTSGSVNVGENGAASYSVPIIVAPGTNGIKPGLSITYNSQRNESSILGQGWDLSGISSITRSGKTIYHDGIVTGINFDAEDKFLLDGNRLQTIVSTDTYGGDGVIYRNAIDDFSEIISHGTSGSGPEWFEVKTKSGLTIEYGHQPSGVINNSKFPNTANASILTWYISKVTDANNNYMSYFYEEIEGNVYIKTILYTGNEVAGLTPFNKVEFFYDNKYDIRNKYIAGINESTKVQIRLIKTYADGNLLREYNFKYCNPSNFWENLNSADYTFAFNRNFLWEIIESSNDGQYNSLKFKYGDNSFISAYSMQIPSTFMSNYDVTTIVGDFDGNGLSDFIVFNSATNPTSYKLYLNNGGVITEKVDVTLPSNFELKSSTNPQIYGIRQADINGDGIDEIILGFKLSAASYKYSIYAYNGTTFFEQNSITGDYNHYLSIGDFDANGQNDILMYNKVNGNWKMLLDNSSSLITGTGYKIDASNSQTLINYGFGNGDFDGDKTSELVVFNLDSVQYSGSYEPHSVTYPFWSGNGNIPDYSRVVINYEPLITYTYYKYHFNQLILDVKVTTNSDQTKSVEIVKANEINNKPIFSYIDYKDYNGDGITDEIFNYSPSFGTGKLNSSNLFQDYNFDPNGDYVTSYENEKSILLDLNSDGNMDKVVLTNAGYNPNPPHSEHSCIIHYDVYWGSNGLISSEPDPDFIKNDSVSFPINANTKILTGDFDGSGNTQLFVYRNYSYYAYTYFFKSFGSNREKYLLNDVYDGLGNLTEIKYKPLADNTVYTPNPSSSLVFPVVSKATPNMFVVSEIKTPDGIGGKNIIKYNYNGFRYDIQNNNFLCFNNIIKSYQNQNKKIIKIFDVNQTYLMPELTFIENRTISNNTLLSKTTYAYAYYSFVSGEPRQRFYQYLGGVTNNNYLTGKIDGKTISMSPNDKLFGNTTSIHTWYNSPNVFYDETKSFLYVTKGAWCPSKVSQVTTAVNKFNQPAFTNKVNYDYFSNGNLQYQKSDMDKPAKLVTIEYTYNNLGLVTNQIVSGDDLPTETRIRTTHFDYDNNGVFVEKITDPLNFVLENKYDILTGEISYQKDINGLETINKYNSFGNLLETYLPNHKKVTNSLRWYDGTDLQNALYVTSTKTEGLENEVKTYYDCLGRVIRTETIGYNGSVLFSDNIYNSAGQLIESTEPYVNGTPYKSIKYNYYSDGSVKEGMQLSVENQLAGSAYSTVNFNYSHLADNFKITTTKTTPEGLQQLLKTYDFLGRIVSSQDNNGIVNYSYFTTLTGFKTEIDYGPATTIIETDEYGRQKSLVDPDAGTILYTYNSMNELIYQKDAKNNESVMEYDKLGRVKKKTTTEGETSYLYDTKRKGMLSSVTGYNGTTADYMYDNFGNLITLKETVDAQQMITNYNYDVYSRLNHIVYPSQFSVSYNYDNKGYMTSVTRDDNNTALWTLESVNNLGQIEKYKYGNNLEINTTFDSYGNLYKDYSTDNSINYEYHFNEKTGNLESRNNIATNYNETFNYDVNERLTTMIVPGAGFKTINYLPNSNGNIDNKTDIGDYYYQNTNKPHQVTGIDNTNNIVSTTNQNIDYYSFNKASNITEGINSLEFTYGVDDERIKTIFKENDVAKKTTYFSGNYEKIKDETTQAIRELSYIYAGSGLCAIYEKNSSGTNNMYYIHTDHLGSITEVVNQQGTLLQRLQYDAWGNRTLAYNNSSFTGFMFDRGYTGHEHLDQFSLINMNGRMYDPALGTMLSADNFVQNPEYSQSYNRYSYCFNNPLKYVDPSGYTPRTGLGKILRDIWIWVEGGKGVASNTQNSSSGGSGSTWWSGGSGNSGNSGGSTSGSYYFGSSNTGSSGNSGWGGYGNSGGPGGWGGNSYSSGGYIGGGWSPPVYHAPNPNVINNALNNANLSNSLTSEDLRQLFKQSYSEFINSFKNNNVEFTGKNEEEFADWLINTSFLTPSKTLSEKYSFYGGNAIVFHVAIMHYEGAKQIIKGYPIHNYFAEPEVYPYFTYIKYLGTPIKYSLNNTDYYFRIQWYLMPRYANKSN